MLLYHIYVLVINTNNNYDISLTVNENKVRPIIITYLPLWILYFFRDINQILPKMYE